MVKRNFCKYAENIVNKHREGTFFMTKSIPAFITEHKTGLKRAVCGLMLAAFVAFGSGGTTAWASTKKHTVKQAAHTAQMLKTAPSENLISMSFPGAQLGYILQSLGKIYGANFSISSAASNQVVTLEFKDAKFKDVLNMITKAANVTITEITPNSYIVQQENEGEDKALGDKAKELRAMEARISKGQMKTFTLSYVSASDVSDALNKVIGNNAKDVFSVSVLGGDGNSGSSTGGSTTSSVSTSSNSSGTREYSTIIVYAANENIMNYITKVITEIDKPKPMVEVEAVFVEVSNNRNSDVGFDWSILTDPINFVESTIGQVIVSGDSVSDVYRKTSIGQMRRTSGVTGSIQTNFTEGSGRGRVLSNPRIRVMSGHTAGFTSETQVPIMNKDSNGEIKTEYKNVGVNLNILPVVLEDNTIYLTVSPSVSSITDTVTLGDTKAPQIASRSAETTVLMRDNETMVIGGLLSDRDIKSMSKVPFLWKLPLFGELFKSTSTTKEHSSISVYIRLKLIKDYMPENLVKLSHQVNIPDSAIDKLLTNHQPKINRVESGSFDEKVKIEGVIPVTDINNPEQKVSIAPLKSAEPAPAPIAPVVEQKPTADHAVQPAKSEVKTEVKQDENKAVENTPAPAVQPAPAKPAEPSKPATPVKPAVNVNSFMY